MRKRVRLSLVLLFLAIGVNAQFQENIDSGRPGNSVGVFTVGKNVFQIEAGTDYYDKTNLYLSNALLKFGITESIEINGGVTYNHSKGNNEIEFYTVGGKVNFFEGGTILPSTGFQTTFNFPSSSAQNATISALFLFGYSFNEKWSYTINFGANIDMGEREVIVSGSPKNVVFVEGVYTFNLSYAVNDKWTIFIEPYGTMDKYYNPKIKMNLNSGISYLINRNLKLDLLGGHDINNDRGLSIGAGISWRLAPKRK